MNNDDLDVVVGWAVHDLTTSITHKGETPGRLDEDCAVLGQAIVGRILAAFPALREAQPVVEERRDPKAKP
jgi:hypothetical protein